MQGLTDLSERDSNELIGIDPTALRRISRYSNGLCQRLGGNLVPTATAQGIKNRLMYDNQYDRKIIQATGIAIKTQNRPLAYEYFQLIVHFCTSNVNLLSANFRGDITSNRTDKFSTKMYSFQSKITQLVGNRESTMQ